MLAYGVVVAVVVAAVVAGTARAQTCTGDGTLVVLNDVIAAGDFVSDQCEATLCTVWQRAMLEQGRVARTAPPQAELRYDTATQQWHGVRPVQNAALPGARRHTATLAQELTPRGGVQVRAARGADGVPVFVHRTQPADAQQPYTDSVWLTQCERADCTEANTYTLAEVPRPAAGAEAPLSAVVLDMWPVAAPPPPPPPSDGAAAVTPTASLAVVHERDGTTDGDGTLVLRLYTPHEVESAATANVRLLDATVLTLATGERRRLGAVVRAHPVTGVAVVVELWLDEALGASAASPGEHVYHVVVHRCEQAACTSRVVREATLSATTALHPTVLSAARLDALVHDTTDEVRVLAWAPAAAADTVPRVLDVRCRTTDDGGGGGTYECTPGVGGVHAALATAVPSTRGVAVIGAALRRRGDGVGVDVELVLTDGRVARFDAAAGTAATATGLNTTAAPTIAAAAPYVEAARVADDSAAAAAWTLIAADGTAVVLDARTGQLLSTDVTAGCGAGGLAVLSDVGAPPHGPASVRACRATAGGVPALAVTTCGRRHCAVPAW